MQLIFHIGAPKTATTSLQHALKPAMGRLAAEGVSYVPTGKLRNSEFGESLRDETPALFGRRVSRRAVRAFVEQWTRPGTDRLLVSEEGHSAYLLHPLKRGSWADHAPRTFRILRHFDDYDFRIVLTVRRQDTYLLSSYAHLVRHDRVAEEFDAYWRNDLDLATMSWRGFIEALRKEYGPDRVTVLPYERIRDGFPDYFRHFLQHACRLPAERVADMEPVEEERNLALSDPAMQIALIINRHLGGSVAQPKLKDLIKDMKQVLPPQAFPRFSPAIADLRAAAAERFAAENRIVSETLLADPHPGFLFD